MLEVMCVRQRVVTNRLSLPAISALIFYEYIPKCMCVTVVPHLMPSVSFVLSWTSFIECHFHPALSPFWCMSAGDLTLMNGPQRTACLAKSCINNHYQLTIPRQWAAQWLHPWQCYTSDKRNTDPPRQCAAACFPPLSWSRSHHPVMSEAADDP